MTKRSRHPSPYPGPEQGRPTLAVQLAELDRRHERGELSDVELEERRQALLGSLGSMPLTGFAPPAQGEPETDDRNPPEEVVLAQRSLVWELPEPDDESAREGEPVSPAPSRESSRLRVWALAGISAAVIGAVAGGVTALVGTGEPAPAVIELPAGPSVAYREAATGPTAILRRSARVLGIRLERAGASSDVPALQRLARSQLPLLRRAERRVSRLPAGRLDGAIHVDLKAGVEAHIAYVRALANLDEARPARALDALEMAEGHAAQAAERYGSAYAELGIPSPVAGSGLATTDGLRGALEDLRQELVERFRPPDVPPVVSSVIGFDGGSTIDVTVSYCDRSPGGAQRFRYTATVNDINGTSETSSLDLVQSAACNDVELSVPDYFAISETATILVTVFNHDTGLSGTGSGNVFVVD